MAIGNSQFERGEQVLGHYLADVVTYTPAVGSALDLSIIVGPEQIVEVIEQDGIKRRHTRECSIPATAQAAGGNGFVASPQIHDVFEFNGVSYMVNQILGRTASMTRVAAILLTTHEEVRQALRRRN